MKSFYEKFKDKRALAAKRLRSLKRWRRKYARSAQKNREINAINVELVGACYAALHMLYLMATSRSSAQQQDRVADQLITAIRNAERMHYE